MTIKQQFNKSRSLFSLLEEPIKLKILPQNGFNEYEGSSLYWDEKLETWVIEFVDQHNFFLIHELGHIFLAKKYNCPYFAKQSIVPVNEKVGNYNIALVDSFVNYNITRHDEIYPIFLDLVDIYLNAGTQRLDSDNLDLLMFFLNLYLDFHYCLKPEDFQIRKQKIFVFFNELEGLILKNRSLTKEKFGIIKKELKKFEEYLEVEKSTTIIHYIFNLLKKVPYWSQSELKKNIKLIYNLKKK